MKKTILALVVALSLITGIATAHAICDIYQGCTGISSTTKGDLLIGTSSLQSFNLLHVGANGSVLLSSSTAPMGVIWVTTSSLGISGGGSGITSINGGSGSGGSYFILAGTNITLATTSTSTTINSSGGGGSGSVSTSSPISVNNFPFWTSVGGALSGTSTLTVSGLNLFAGGAFNASGTITQNGIAISTATNTNSLFTSSTTMFFIDGNRGDTYTVDGSILRPYKSFSAAIASSTGLASVSYYVAPGTYVEGAPLSFPSSTFQLIGNEAVLVVPSGVTFTGQYDIYDLTVSGNVLENDTSTTNVHQWENSVITGNFTVNGLTTFTGMTFPTRATVITVATGTNLTALNNYFANSFVVNAGMANLDGIGIFASTTNPVIKVTAGGQLTMNGGTVFNYGGPGIDVSASGATSSPNEISNVSIVVLATSTTSTVFCGTSQCLLSDLATLSDLAGGFHAPSGTAWTTSYNENKVIFNAFSFGTSTMATATLLINGSLNTLTTNALGLFSSTGTLTAYGGASGCAAGNAVTTISAQGTTTCVSFAPSTTIPINNNQILNGFNFVTAASSVTWTAAITHVATTTFQSSTLLTFATSSLLKTDANGSISAYAGFACTTGSLVTSISATGTASCVTTSTILAGYSTSTAVGTVTTGTANTATQLAIGLGGTAIGFYASTTFTSSTGVFAAPTGTFSGTFSVATNTISAAKLFVNGDTAIGSSTDNGLLSVTNASNTIAFKISTTTNATSSAVSLNILGNVSSSPTAPISVLQILGSGHINSTGTTPTLSSCGTNPTIVGTDVAGTITVGTVAATGCTITFQIPYEATPHCQVTSETSLASMISYTRSTTAITVSDVGSIVGDLLDYDCMMGGNL